VRIVVALLGVLVLVVGSAMVWQHWRYLRVRRDVVQDHQSILHAANAFHAITFLRTAPGSDVLEEVRALRRATEGSEATWIYAGKAVLTAVASAQIGEKDWSAIVLLQYPSRAAFDRHARSESLRAALGRFEEVYTQGFERWRGVSAMFPQLFLALRAGQILRGQPSHFPFVRSERLEALPRAEVVAKRLRAERALGAEAIAIVNLVKSGTPEQQAADRRYGASMLGAMAEGGYGPMHVGRAVRVERDYDFDRVMIVYYPGVDFFADLAQSEFFQSIVGDKQLGDTQAVITVPILDRL